MNRLIKIILIGLGVLVVVYLVMSLMVNKSVSFFDWSLSEYNSGQSCQYDYECKRSGCGGEICGAGGGATICFRPKEFGEKFKGKECVCLFGKCGWGKKFGFGGLGGHPSL